ncbi:MAG: hypothetical protein QM796_21500 [Chthoniobacteraceae bacterium]
MKRIALHFPRLWKALLYLAFTLSWVTGSLWFYLHRWVRIQGDFGDEPSPWEHTLRQIHGGAAMLMMVFFGYLLASHVPAGLRSQRNRLFGLILVYALAFMIVTAYGLYYIGGDSFREIVSWAHLITGFALPLILILHIWSGHRSAPAKESKLRNAA